MTVIIENAAGAESLKSSLERFKISRDERREPNLARFFGILPDFEDGLEYQRKARNEWD